MLTYIPVSFLFSFKKGFGLGLKIGFGFGIGNLIVGAVSTVGSALARRMFQNSKVPFGCKAGYRLTGFRYLQPVPAAGYRSMCPVFR